MPADSLLGLSQFALLLPPLFQHQTSAPDAVVSSAKLHLNKEFICSFSCKYDSDAVFYSFLLAPLFSSLHSPANPGFIFQFPSLWVLPLHSPTTCLFPHLPSSMFAFDLYQGQRFHNWVLRTCLIMKVGEYKMILNRTNAIYFFMLLLSNSFLVICNASTFILYWKKKKI